MQKGLLGIALCLLSLLTLTAYGQTTIIDHESPATSTNFTYFGNCTLDGTQNAVIANPDPTGLNTSANVGNFVKSDCAATFAGCFGDPAPTTAIDLTSDNHIRMKVWMDHPGTVEIKLENSTDGGPNWIGSQSVSAINQWVEVEFDLTDASFEGPFAPAAGFTYSQVVVFFDFGLPGTGADVTSYFDDIETFFVFLLDQIDLPVTFEDPAVDYTLLDFGDNSSVLAADPDGSGNTVACTTKPIIAPTWAGTTIGAPDFANSIAVDDSNTVMTVRVYSPDAGIPVRLKIEDSTDPTKSVETEANTTVANAWETLTFDFANEAPGTAVLNTAYNFDMASIFFNFGTDGATAGEKTYYWDDVQFTGGTGGPGPGPGLDQVDLPITFEDTTVDYSIVDFGGNISVLGPDPTGATNSVMCTNKPVGAEVWAGTIASTTSGLANPIPITATNTKMTVRVYSPDAGTPILLKIEDSTDPSKSVETITNTTVANAWETLEFDFANEEPGTPALDLSYTYDLVVIFFNFGTDGATAGDKTYYWDDVMMSGATACSSASAPTGLSSTITPAGVTLSWTPIPSSVGCLIQGGAVGGSGAGTLINTGFEVSSQNIPAAVLTPGTTYAWKVRCTCGLPAIDNATPFSVTSQFFFPLLRTVELTSNSPVSTTAALVIESYDAREVVVQVLDLNGRILGEWPASLLEGQNGLSIDLSTYPNGYYLINLEGAEMTAAHKILVQH